jgi:DNA-binding protein H-NS
MDISNLNIKQLNQLIESAKVRIAELEKSGAADARSKLSAMAREMGYDIGDLFSGGKAKAAVSERVRRPAKPKYKDPNSDQTWTGRGRKPLWVVSQLAQGRSLDSLKI